MWLKANKCLADSQKYSTGYDELELELQRLTEEKYLLAKAGRKDDITTKMRNRIKELEAICESRAEKLNESLLDLHAAWRLLENIRALIPKDEGDGSNLTLITRCTEDIEPAFREGTRFELCSYLLQASRVVPFLYDEDMERERDQFLDVIAMRENLMSWSIAPLSKHEKRIGSDAESMWLLNAVGAMELDAIYRGESTLKTLGRDSKELVMVIESAIGKALPMKLASSVGEITYG
ncbi:hypothetical protein KOM00_12315 [Geomonas sp. Red69]|uniref:hypothetical protein n=1 Tax=Geomonas diazotrophica TaxID=2843197 RepID=UPI001C122960|nr:hypothetical protein [Geomonas diazotrophica]MBU5637512.1 hypothetical protein [Geomonas diazotrophica]